MYNLDMMRKDCYIPFTHPMYHVSCSIYILSWSFSPVSSPQRTLYYAYQHARFGPVRFLLFVFLRMLGVVAAAAAPVDSIWAT